MQVTFVTLILVHSQELQDVVCFCYFHCLQSLDNQIFPQIILPHFEASLSFRHSLPLLSCSVYRMFVLALFGWERAP